MNKFLFLSLLGLVLFSCNENTSIKNKTSLYPFLQKELETDFANTSSYESKKEFLREKTNVTIYYQKANKRTNEIDIYLTPAEDTLYNYICNFYNSKFKTENKNTNFNTWQTDSSEYILYKNSDSSILVNIYRK